MEGHPWTVALYSPFIEKLMYRWALYESSDVPLKSEHFTGPAVNCGVFARDARSSVEKKRKRAKHNASVGDPKEQLAAPEVSAYHQGSHDIW